MPLRMGCYWPRPGCRGQVKAETDPLRELRQTAYGRMVSVSQGPSLRSVLARVHGGRLAAQGNGLGMNHITVRARNTDPETSHQAALEEAAKVADQYPGVYGNSPTASAIRALKNTAPQSAGAEREG